MNNVLLFNANQCPWHYRNLYIGDVYYVLTDTIIGDGYFFMQWLFPVQGVSKWHTHTKGLNNQEVEFLQNSTEIKTNVLNSAKFILNYFQLEVKDKQIYLKPTLNQRDYWLRGIGHEEKKLSRIMLSLKLCGFEALATSLQQISMQTLAQKGFKTGKDPKPTIEFWHGIFDSKQLY